MAMTQTKAQAAPHPLFSSPKRLTIGGLFVIMAVWAIQTSSGIPASLSFAPIELSSNVLATMGLAWTIIQLRSYRANPRLRRAWTLCAVGMALLAIEGSLGETFLNLAHGPDEMGLSIAIWLLAACLIFRGGRVFAPRRSVVAMLWIGFAIQLAAQTVGWISVIRSDYPQPVEWLEYLNDMGELSAVLGYVCALLLAEFGPLKSYQFPAASIGKKARAVIRDFGLLQAGPPPIRSPLPGVPVRWIANGSLLLWRVLRAAPAVQMSGGPNVLAQIVDLVRLGAKGISPNSYYALGLFRSPRRDAVDEFVTNVEAESGLSAGPHSVRYPACAGELNDGLIFTQLCEAARLPVAPVYATVTGGVVSALRDHAAFDRDLVARDRHGGARTARSFKRIEPFVYRSPFGETLGFEDILMDLASAPAEMLIQPDLKNHESVAFLSDDSQVVFRAVTCLDDEGRPHVTHALAQVSSHAGPVWAGAQGREWGAAIDLETGALGALCGGGSAPSVACHDDHPATGVAVRGVRLKHWPDVCDLAARAHGVFGGCAIVCWDIALTPRGAVILRGDSRVDFDFLQRCYGTPLGRSPLAPMMDRRLDALLAEQLERFTVDGRRTTH
jgi:hypothetical protein